MYFGAENFFEVHVAIRIDCKGVHKPAFFKRLTCGL